MLSQMWRRDFWGWMHRIFAALQASWRSIQKESILWTPEIRRDIEQVISEMAEEEKMKECQEIDRDA